MPANECLQPYYAFQGPKCSPSLHERTPISWGTMPNITTYNKSYNQNLTKIVLIGQEIVCTTAFHEHIYQLSNCKWRIQELKKVKDFTDEIRFPIKSDKLRVS